jgi:hypothetical protein
MADLLQTVWDQWERMRAGSKPVAETIQIPAERCLPEGVAGYLIHEEKMYFTVRMNEMHLAANRQWFANYDPLVVIVTEFDYGAKRIAVPAIIGPDLIPDLKNAGAPIHGAVLEDIVATGPHPYRGGDVVISVRLYQIQTGNLARSLLKTISSLSKICVSVHELEASIAIAGAVLTGVEGLLGLGTTVCLAAYRGSLAPIVSKPFRAQFCALVSPPAPRDISRVSVIDGRLCVDALPKPEPYRVSDYVLISVDGIRERPDIAKLQFSDRRVEALKALTEGKDGIERAKGILTTAYADMLASPDMIAPQSDILFGKWCEELKSKKEKLRHLAVGTDGEQLTSLARKLNQGARLLDM